MKKFKNNHFALLFICWRKKVNVYFFQALFLLYLWKVPYFVWCSILCTKRESDKQRFCWFPIAFMPTTGSIFSSVNCSALCDSKLWSSFLFFFKMNKYFKKETVNGPKKRLLCWKQCTQMLRKCNFLKSKFIHFLIMIL